MTVLVLGLLLFLLPHLAVGTRLAQRAKVRLGASAYRLGFSLIALLALGLMIYGMSSAPFVALWQPMVWAQHLAPLLMLLACYLLLLSQLGGALCRYSAHPMSLAVALWAVAHLLANGDLASVLLFASFAGFALLAIAKQYRRGVRPQPRVGRLGRRHEVWLALLTLVLFGSLVWLHPWLMGGPVGL
ncbi:NnrU family protein [Ferrimonas pelagia]|uniref:NnrU family protein n=1 Tax=Ferrimonas pelagia TaxID=1177826 RepID=A0ABP9F6Y3_9GAMM